MIANEKYRWKLLAGLVFAIGLTCVIMTKSRTSLAAVCFGVAVIKMMRSHGSQRLILGLGVGTAVAAAMVALAFFGVQATNDMDQIATMGRGEDVNTLTGRLPLWEMLLDSIQESPWIGHGYLAYWNEEQVEYLSSTLKWEIRFPSTVPSILLR